MADALVDEGWLSDEKEFNTYSCLEDDRHEDDLDDDEQELGWLHHSRNV